MKKFIKNPWVIAVGSTVIGGVLLSFVLDWIKGVDWLSTLKVVIKFIANIIVTFLNFELKAWWVLVAIALLFVALIIYSKILDTKEKNNPISFLSYTKDFAVGYTWEWEYIKTSDGKHTIANLHPICSECEMILRKNHTLYGKEMKCLRCNTTQEWEDYYLTDAQMLIEDNIKKKYLQNQ